MMIQVLTLVYSDWLAQIHTALQPQNLQKVEGTKEEKCSDVLQSDHSLNV